MVTEVKELRDSSDFTTLDALLDEEGIREEVTVAATKRVIALKLREAMRKRGLTKVAMAREMKTSRQQLDRVLDPNEHNVTLDSLVRAALSVGCILRVDLV